MAGNTLQEYVDEIDPILWESIQILTMSTAERTDPSSISAEACHIRFVRRFFIFCTMMFCINSQYNIEILLGDAPMETGRQEQHDASTYDGLWMGR